SGVGLWVQLDAAHDVTTVTVTTLEDGWSAQIYVADQPGSSLDAWGPARTSGDNLPAVQRFDLNARGQYVLIWCTQLPQSDKLQIGDVKVEGRGPGRPRPPVTATLVLLDTGPCRAVSVCDLP